MATLWLVKSQEGNVRGPLGTSEILTGISKGEIAETDKIAEYPGANWKAVSNHPEFYDKLLEVLEHGQAQAENPSYSPKQKTKSKGQPADPEIVSSSFPQRGRAERVQQSVPGPTHPATGETKHSESAPPVNKPEPEIIELKKLKKVVKKKKVQKSILPLAIAGITLAAGFYLLTGSDLISGTDKRVRLLIPQVSQSEISASKSGSVNDRLKAGLVAFAKDDRDGYLAAQNEFVAAIESEPKNQSAAIYLCATYAELWPLTAQTSSDLTALSTVAVIASRTDPNGTATQICKSYDLFIEGKVLEASSAVEAAIAKSGDQPSPFLYYLKGRVFEVRKELESANSYFQEVQRLFPQWLGAFSAQAKVFASLQRYDKAAKRYSEVLLANPKHRVAQIELGILEVSEFGNLARGEAFLSAGLNPSHEIPTELASRGFVALSEMELKKGNSSKALEFAHKSYAFNSGNAAAKNLILQLGGSPTLKNSQRADVALVFEGDQMLREGDLNAAQAHFRTAFEINPQNSVAAMKAAEVLWKLSLSSEAIEWLNKAIRAEPTLMDAYVLQADYFSQRFDFASAGKILAKANQIKPGNYKVYRGLALVESRRFNFPSAAEYAKKAIQIYEGDVASHIVLANAFTEMRDFAKGFTAASRARELDENSVDAQIAYAKALVGVRGISVGAEHLSRLASLYPNNSEYQIALGDIYFQDKAYYRAEEPYYRASRMDSKPKTALLKLGNTYRAQQKFDSALDAYMRSAELDPSDVEPLVAAGQLALEMKKPVEAQRQFRRVLKVNPEYPLVNYYIGRASFISGNYDEALRFTEAEKKKNPNLADPYILAAEILTRLEQYTSCAKEYQQAVRIRPLGALIYVKMAMCYRLSGNIDAALSMINTAKLQESGEAEVYKEQGAIFEMKDEINEAIGAYRQYLVLAPNATDRAEVEQKIESLSSQ